MRRGTRIFIDILILLHCIGLIAVLWTGGYAIEILGKTLKSSSLLPVVRGLTILFLIRILVASGIKNFILVVISLTISVAAVESVIRTWDPQISQPSLVQVHQTSEIYDWELKPGARGVGLQGETIEINSHGFRDLEKPINKPNNVKRIAVLGDSFTFGMAVNLEDTFVKQLEGLLNQQDYRVETLNFGVIGYHLWQYVALLENKTFEYKPDLIVIGIFLDDIMGTVPPDTSDPEWRPRNPFEQIISKKHQGGKLRLWNIIRNVNKLLETKFRYKRGHTYLQGIEERKKLIGPDDPGHAYYKAQIGDLDQKYYDDMARSLAKVKKLARENNTPVIILYIPDGSQLHESKRQHINDFLTATATLLGIPLIDATPEFEAFLDPRELYLFPMDAHTSPKGHSVMAELLFEEIKNQRMLDN